MAVTAKMGLNPEVSRGLEELTGSELLLLLLMMMGAAAGAAAGAAELDAEEEAI